MKKVLFIATYRKDRSPAQRFRFEQYFKYLEGHDFNCHFSYFIDEHNDILYHYGKYFQKLKIILNAARIRFANVLNRNNYDIIFISRESFMLGNVFFERMLKRSRARLIY